MSRVDYGQVPECNPPDMSRKYRIDYQKSPLDFKNKKWISGEFLNLNRKGTLSPGSKGYVGQRESNGKWCIIRVYRVV